MAKIIASVTGLAFLAAFCVTVKAHQCYHCIHAKDFEFYEPLVPVHDSCESGKEPKSDLLTTCTPNMFEHWLGPLNQLGLINSTTANLTAKSDLNIKSWHCGKAVFTVGIKFTVRTCVPQVEGYKVPEKCVKGNVQDLAKGNDDVAKLINLLLDRLDDTAPDVVMDPMCACPGEKCNSGNSLRFSAIGIIMMVASWGVGFSHLKVK